VAAPVPLWFFELSVGQVLSSFPASMSVQAQIQLQALVQKQVQLQASVPGLVPAPARFFPEGQYYVA